MADSNSKLDGIAAQLKAKADEVLESTGTDEEAAKAGGHREAMRKMALLVKEQAEKGLDGSKEYLTKVMGQVSVFASETSSNATSQFNDAKERGLSHTDAAKEVASSHYATAKDAASVHIAGLQTNLNKAIAQGQAQGTASGTTDGEAPAEEETLSFPFNWIAYLVALCSGKGTATSSTGTTSKDFSVESLQNAAAHLTDTFTQEAQSASEEAKGAGSKAANDASGKAEASKEES